MKVSCTTRWGVASTASRKLATHVVTAVLMMAFCSASVLATEVPGCITVTPDNPATGQEVVFGLDPQLITVPWVMKDFSLVDEAGYLRQGSHQVFDAAGVYNFDATALFGTGQLWQGPNETFAKYIHSWTSSIQLTVYDPEPLRQFLVNLPGNLYGAYSLGHSTYALDLGPGDWEFSLVNPDSCPGALYWAWQPWSTAQNWHTACHIFDGASGHILGQHNATSTAQQAFWDTVGSDAGKMVLHLDESRTVRMGVSDSVIGDNGGGLSVLVTQVPEPSSIVALLMGIGTLGGFASRRRK